MCGCGAVGLLLLCGVLFGCWLCCGRPMCSCSTHEERIARGYKSQPAGVPAMARGPNTRPYNAMDSTTTRSTEELAMALSSVLKAHRFACMLAYFGWPTTGVDVNCDV